MPVGPLALADEVSLELMARIRKQTAADLGNISACWFAVFALAQFPVGAALDRIGPRRTVPLLMLAAVAGTLLFARAASTLDCLVAMGRNLCIERHAPVEQFAQVRHDFHLSGVNKCCQCRPRCVGTQWATLAAGAGGIVGFTP